MGGRIPFLLFAIAAGWIVLFPCRTVAAPWETVPPDHWAYAEIEHLQTLGFLRGLDPSEKPYTRGEIASALEQEDIPGGEPARGIFKLLEGEFLPRRKADAGWNAFAGGRIFAGLEGSYGAAGREAGYGVLQVGVGNARMGIFTALRADRDLAENPAYTGKIWSDFAGLTEQAYFTVAGQEQRWMLLLGRDHLWWGPGSDHLLLNAGVRGLDQIRVRARWRWGSFTALIGQVSDFEDSTGARISRFLSGHRLEIRPGENLRIGISETLLFTGGVRLGSMNPLLPFYGELVNERSEGNGLIALDFVAYPAAGAEVYGEILLDDIQLERKNSSDLEPTEWGWLIGGRWSGWDGLWGAGIFYQGITNRTYNALDPKYRYLSYGLPVGSNLGNDGDLWQLDLSLQPDARLRVGAFWQYLRRGEGSVTAAFDTTYMAYTLDEGYSESFPSGVVEQTHTVGLRASFLPDPRFQFEGWIGRDWIQNAGHVSGEDDGGFRGRATLRLRLDYLLTM